MMTELDLARKRYESRLKAERPRKDLGYAFKEAWAEGYTLGLKIGQAVGRIQLSQKLLHAPITPRDELLQLPPGELEALADSWETQLFAGRE